MYTDCYYCGGKVVEKRVQKVCWWGEELKALIDNVPAGVCTQCGERFYKAGVLKEIESMLKNKDSFTSISIEAAEFAEPVTS